MAWYGFLSMYGMTAHISQGLGSYFIQSGALGEISIASYPTQGNNSQNQQESHFFSTLYGIHIVATHS